MNAYRVKMKVVEYIDGIPSDSDARSIDEDLENTFFTAQIDDDDSFSLFMGNCGAPLLTRKTNSIYPRIKNGRTTNLVARNNIVGRLIAEIPYREYVLSIVNTGEQFVVIKGKTHSVSDDVLFEALVNDLENIIEKYATVNISANRLVDAFDLVMTGKKTEAGMS